MSQFILVGQTPSPEPDVQRWGEWLETANRVVRKTEADGGVMVSTVFLGLDHSFGDGPPLLFETMIFGGPQDGYQARYSTWAEAEAGHAAACALLLPLPRKALRQIDPGDNDGQ